MDYNLSFDAHGHADTDSKWSLNDYHYDTYTYSKCYTHSMSTIIRVNKYNLCCLHIINNTKYNTNNNDNSKCNTNTNT